MKIAAIREVVLHAVKAIGNVRVQLHPLGTTCCWMICFMLRPLYYRRMKPRQRGITVWVVPEYV